MTVLLTLDTEQANLVRLGIEATQAILRCRLERTDPDEVISNACKLQGVKLDQVRAQMRAQAQPVHENIEDVETANLQAMVRNCQHATDAQDFLDRFERALVEYMNLRMLDAQRKPVPSDFEGVGEPWE